jgi:hypothetical protein
MPNHARTLYYVSQLSIISDSSSSRVPMDMWGDVDYGAAVVDMLVMADFKVELHIAPWHENFM